MLASLQIYVYVFEYIICLIWVDGLEQTSLLLQFQASPTEGHKVL